MTWKITRESAELIAEEIIDAVESTEDRDTQVDMIKAILEDNGIVEIIED